MKSSSGIFKRGFGLAAFAAALAFAVFFALGFAACSNGSESAAAPFAGFTTQNPGDSSGNGANGDGSGAGESCGFTAPVVKAYIIYFDSGFADENTERKKYTQSIQENVPTALRTVEDMKLVRYGWYFAGWATAEDATEASYCDGASYLATKEATLYALWSVDPVYNVKTAVSEGGIIFAKPAVGPAGTSVVLTPKALTGYEYSSCDVTDKDGNPVSVTNHRFSLPQSDVSVKASFTKIVYKVELGNVLHGAVALDRLDATLDDTVKITITPDQGYRLKYLNVVADDGSVVFSVNNKTYSCSFKMPPKNVRVEATFEELPQPASGDYTMLPDGTRGSESDGGTYVTFGLWPQTVKAAKVRINENDTKAFGGYTCCRGDDGQWYCKVKEEVGGYDGDSYTYHDGQKVEKSSANSYKWFKVEPIKWRVLTNSYEGSGKKLLLAENALAGVSYYDGYECCENELSRSKRKIDGKDVYPGDYEHSRMRAFLNGLSYYKNLSCDTCEDYLNKGFLQTAFDDNLRKMIVDTSVDNSIGASPIPDNETYPASDYKVYGCGNTVDKVFLMSYYETKNQKFKNLKPGRRYYIMDKNGQMVEDKDWELYREATDFALANGVFIINRGNNIPYKYYVDDWSLRSHSYKLTREGVWASHKIVCAAGYRSCSLVSVNSPIGDAKIGVVPAICVDDN